MLASIQRTQQHFFELSSQVEPNMAEKSPFKRNSEARESAEFTERIRSRSGKAQLRAVSRYFTPFVFEFNRICNSKYEETSNLWCQL